MSFRVRLAEEALDDLRRLTDFWLERGEFDTARRAQTAIREGVRILAIAPFTCRKAAAGEDPLLRELVISLGGAGYVALYHIDDDKTVTVLAVRHRREDDFL